MKSLMMTKSENSNRKKKQTHLQSMAYVCVFV